MGDECGADSWIRFSECYDQKVFSLTKFKKNREAILQRIGNGKILNLGTGPTSYMNKELVRLGVVTAKDFCQNMLDVAVKEYKHPNLEYKLADSTNLPFGAEFDYVIALNSILPPEREQVVEIYKQVRKVLKKEGKFVAVLAAWDVSGHINEELGENAVEVNWDKKAEKDTNGWQCTHTPGTIYFEMKKAGWTNFDIEILFLDSNEEINEISRLYGYNTFQASKRTGGPLPPFFEYILTAIK